MKVICKNVNCQEFDKEIEVADWDGLHSYGLFVLKQCPNCKKLRQIIPGSLVEQDKDSVGFEGVAFAKIGSMSPQERKQVLKKRSNEHFKKHIKPRKEYLDRAMIGKE